MLHPQGKLFLFLMLYPQEKLLLFFMLFPQEKLALPSCHLRLALVILQFLAKYLLDGLRVQFQMYSRLCPWLFTWPDYKEEYEDEGGFR